MNRSYFITMPTAGGDWIPVARKAFIGSAWEWPQPNDPGLNGQTARFDTVQVACDAARYLVGCGLAHNARVCGEMLAVIANGPRPVALLAMDEEGPKPEASA